MFAMTPSRTFVARRLPFLSASGERRLIQARLHGARFVPALLAMLLGPCAAVPSHALGLEIYFQGPLTSVIWDLSAMNPSIKALIVVIAFFMTLVSLAALRSFGPVVFFIGLTVFGAVGVSFAGSILGAVI